MTESDRQRRANCLIHATHPRPCEVCAEIRAGREAEESADWRGMAIRHSATIARVCAERDEVIGKLWRLRKKLEKALAEDEL